MTGKHLLVIGVALAAMGLAVSTFVVRCDEPPAPTNYTHDPRIGP